VTVPRADFSAKQVDSPPQRWCRSGHFTTEVRFKADGSIAADYMKKTGKPKQQVNWVWVIA
jgi:hypothetical protein